MKNEATGRDLTDALSTSGLGRMASAASIYISVAHSIQYLTYYLRLNESPSAKSNKFATALEFQRSVHWSEM
jgi:hypothetical protein